jgi:hypothetical protein
MLKLSETCGVRADLALCLVVSAIRLVVVFFRRRSGARSPLPVFVLEHLLRTTQYVGSPRRRKRAHQEQQLRFKRIQGLHWCGLSLPTGKPVLIHTKEIGQALQNLSAWHSTIDAEKCAHGSLRAPNCSGHLPLRKFPACGPLMRSPQAHQASLEGLRLAVHLGIV